MRCTVRAARRRGIAARRWAPRRAPTRTSAGSRIDEQRDPGHERRQRIGDLARAPQSRRSAACRARTPGRSRPRRRPPRPGRRRSRVMPQILMRVRIVLIRERRRLRASTARTVGGKPEARVVVRSGEIQPVGGERGRSARAIAAASSSAIHAGIVPCRRRRRRARRRCCAPCDAGKRWRRIRSARKAPVASRRCASAS